MTDNDIDAIRQRAQAATPGPWQWYGNTDVYNIYLSSTRWGRQIVMDFERWGMNSAQPSFVEGRTWKPDPESTFDFGVSGSLTRARDMAVYEVAPRATTRKDPAVYRADIRGLRNPDAVFIAAARQDVDTLLAKVDELTAELAEVADAIAPTVTIKPVSAAARFLQSLYQDWVKTAHGRLEQIDELTAALTQSRAQAATYANEIGTLTAENARLRQQRDNARTGATR